MGEVQLEWCLTAKMIADLMTKLLQGGLFAKSRDLVMGIVPMTESDVGEISRRQNWVQKK